MPPTNLFSSCAPAARSNRLTTCDSRSLQASESCAVVNPFGFCSKAASSCCVASFSCSLVSLTAFHLSAPIGAGLGFFVLRRGGGARVTKKASTALAATRLALNAVS